ncbi:radical SAM protein [Nonomuraea sp. FMUSA5-5]|uniref:Radical SAM protein n=1 Tax=Nonomuraea composti TaxID=2720023 RepID=A0ABX1B1N2_9ACTN|nr:radical SAM protein [Nonomuraea sp. FMUSA5-5]
MSGSVVMVADTHPACEVLGPGVRYCVWVQGCPLRCRGCVSPEWIPFEGGTAVPVADLADEIVRTAADGLTLSGGEPFAQAQALAELVTRVRARRDLSVMSYSGHTLEWLRRHGDEHQRRLLSLLDLLVDGPYVAGRHAALRWRGSANQRLHRLTDRHRDLPGPDESAGLRIEITPDRRVHWLGVPPVPGFGPAFSRAFSRAFSERPVEGRRE